MPERPAREPARRLGGWQVLAVATIPIACCGLPLLLATVGSAGVGAAVGGVTGLFLLALAAAGAVRVVRSRRACRTVRRDIGEVRVTRLGSQPGPQVRSRDTEREEAVDVDSNE